MQSFFLLFTHFAIVFAIMLLYYFVPAILFYYEFYIRNRVRWQSLKIQQKYPDGCQIRREIKSSLIAVIIFSFTGLLMYECAIRGYTKVYFNITDYSLLYFGLSFFINLFINDALFYWTHRFMHLKRVFRYIHLVHHKSSVPTPFDFLTFHPVEAIIHGMTYFLLIIIIPIHPIMFELFHLYNLILNVGGHSGYELMPQKLRRLWFFNWQNTTTNHDLHHKKFKCNYGNYFIIWDMLMNTLGDKLNK